MYTLHGHLGGVLLLATTGLGDTLVSVGIDRVAKVVYMDWVTFLHQLA